VSPSARIGDAYASAGPRIAASAGRGAGRPAIDTPRGWAAPTASAAVPSRLRYRGARGRGRSDPAASGGYVLDEPRRRVTLRWPVAA